MPVPDPSPLPSYFLGHAGVGLVFDPSAEGVRENVRQLGREIAAVEPRPRAILVVSGHFTANEIHGPGVVEVNVKRTTHIQHDFVGDFHDSHPFVYEYDWPHLDAPELGQEVFAHLKAKGVKAKRVERGIDHGVWVPFKIAFPEDAPLDIPVVLVSTYHGRDLAAQLALGRALSDLRSQGFLLVGSGMAVHSFELSAATSDPSLSPEHVAAARDRIQAYTERFDGALREAVAGPERGRALLELERHEDFKSAHPTVEHLTPLYVVAGAAGDDAPSAVLGADALKPGMSHTNWRFGPAPA